MLHQMVNAFLPFENHTHTFTCYCNTYTLNQNITPTVNETEELNNNSRLINHTKTTKYLLPYNSRFGRITKSKIADLHKSSNAKKINVAD